VRRDVKTTFLGGRPRPLCRNHRAVLGSVGWVAIFGWNRMERRQAVRP
jgi:hypothetical protein